MVLLQLLIVVIPTEHYLLSAEAQPSRVRGKHHLLESVWAIPFKTTDEVLRELERRHNFANTWITQTWDEYPLSEISKAVKLVVPDNHE